MLLLFSLNCPKVAYMLPYGCMILMTVDKLGGECMVVTVGCKLGDGWGSLVFSFFIGAREFTCYAVCTTLSQSSLVLDASLTDSRLHMLASV
jgi:hypothetical protein